MKNKPVPLGIEFYETVSIDCYYVDKTNIIDTISRFPYGTCLLFTRPRRFGKSLMLSMLQTFYEQSSIDKSKYFIDKNIWVNQALIAKEFQQYPLIHINLKNAIGLDFSSMLEKIKECVRKEYDRHNDILSLNTLNKEEIEYFNLILSKKENSNDLSSSLSRLSEFLFKVYKKKVVILIDEYDSPVHYAYDYDYYDEAIMFFKQFYGESLKANPVIRLAILTGILQIAKESLFSGVNNLVVNSVLSKNMDEGFGFNEKEVKELLNYYNFKEDFEIVKQYYGGYKFGDAYIYNPLSVLSYIQNGGDISSYWNNTGESNTLEKLLSIKNLNALLPLLNDESIQSEIDIAISYKDLDNSFNSVCSYLLSSGYLTIKDRYDYFYELVLPNKEIKQVFNREIRSRYLKVEHLPLAIKLKKAFEEADTKLLEKLIVEYLLSTFSCFEMNSEKNYQILLATTLAIIFDNAYVKNEFNAGTGRADIVLIPKENKEFGLIIEAKHLKARTTKERLDNSSISALKQILSNGYDKELAKLGIKNIILFGVAFNKNKVSVTSKRLTDNKY